MIHTLALFVGSKSDLPDCEKGMEYLLEMVFKGKVVLTEVCKMSALRNIKIVLDVLEGESAPGGVDAIIAAAGPEAHLAEMLDAFRGHQMRDKKKIPIIGVTVNIPKGREHDVAAEISASEASGSRVIYRSSAGPFQGNFLRACQYAVEGNFPELKEMTPQPPEFWTLDQALAEARKVVATKQSACF